MIKKILMVLFVKSVLFSSLFSQQYGRYTVVAIPNSFRLKIIDKADSSHLIGAGFWSDTIHYFRSTDCGYSWDNYMNDITIRKGGEFVYRALPTLTVSAPSVNNCYYGLEKGIIRKVKDFGKSYEDYSVQDSYSIVSIKMVTDDSGYAMLTVSLDLYKNISKIIRTYNGWKNWEEVKTPPGFINYWKEGLIVFDFDHFGYYGGYSDDSLKMVGFCSTNDAGKSWFITKKHGFMNDFEYKNENEIWGSGGYMYKYDTLYNHYYFYPMVIKTVDNGKSWDTVYVHFDFGSPMALYNQITFSKDVCFISNNYKWIYRTIDNGNNWTYFRLPSKEEPNLSCNPQLIPLPLTIASNK